MSSRLIRFSAASLGILIFLIPVASNAQASETTSKTLARMDAFPVESAELPVSPSTDDVPLEQIHPELTPAGMISPVSSVESISPVSGLKPISRASDTQPWEKLNEDDDWQPPEPSNLGTGINLLPVFGKLHQDEIEHAASTHPVNLENDGKPAGYHWKGLLWESLGFISIETTFRLFTDPYLRHLTADQPYWRDYGISMTHWDMNRWSDGDDFLVDDIGHPMQGAVSAFIEIQNSPTARMLRFSNTEPYWHSRFVAFLWAVVYSTHQKIGPMGEAAVGSAGGYTYPLNCPYPCTTPGVEYTNNTGWTDFIVTPVGGMVWAVGEDAIDRYISDRVQNAMPNRLFPKIFRGAMNPTRTMANALRGKNPWYRDYMHPMELRDAVHFESEKDAVIKQMPGYQLFPHFNAFSLLTNAATCYQCRRWTYGSGLGFSTRLSRWADFVADFNYQPSVSPLPSDRAGGNAIMASFGLRSGLQTEHYALKASVGPGLVSYDHAYLVLASPENPVPPIGRVTHFAAAMAVNGDYVITRNLAIRGVLGNTPIRYLGPQRVPPGIGDPPSVNWLSHQTWVTNENWTYQMGPVLSF